ncbi:MAG: hypothetical protein HOP19_21430 [Acidobacteria bacterium]|nr:hypothetical protein [Acidobacteriota bacterium]
MQKISQSFLSFILICLFQPAGTFVASANDELTAEEKRAAIVLANAFMKQWEETGDMKQLVESFYAPDFIECFVEREKRNLAQKGDPAKTREFAFGLAYQPALLETAAREDWQRLYVAMMELTFCLMTHYLNQQAGAMLHGKELEFESEKMMRSFERMLSPEVRKELLQHRILKSYFSDDDDALPAIQTVEEMREIAIVLEKTTASMKKTVGSNAYQPTLVARRLATKLRMGLQPNQVSDGRVEYGLKMPRDAKVIYMPTMLMHFLVIAKVEGHYKVYWAEVISA